MSRVFTNGFGYVTSRWAQEDSVSLSSDSNLSSTSLVRTLIDPSSSEESIFREDRSESLEERYERVRDSVRESISYLRQSDTARGQGLNIDYEELRKKDEARTFDRQPVPIISDRYSRLLERDQSIGEPLEDLTIPLMAQLGLKSRKQSSRGKPAGMVAELLGFMETHPVPASNRRRSMFLKMVKEQLDDDEDEEDENRTEETDEMRKLREEKEAESKKREEEVFKRHTDREKMVIKEALGKVPTLTQSVYLPFGKEGILSGSNVNSEQFFKEDSTPRPSYDDYYSHPENFGNIRVFRHIATEDDLVGND